MNDEESVTAKNNKRPRPSFFSGSNKDDSSQKQEISIINRIENVSDQPDNISIPSASNANPAQKE